MPPAAYRGFSSIYGKMDHIHEIFEHDPRPTFLVDLYKHERQTASYNQALHRHDGLLDALSATDSASSKFRGWWIDQGAEESHHWYKGSLWIKFTARKRWMVVCCLQASQMTDSPSDAVLDISPPLRNGELVKPTTRRQHGHKHIAERGAKNESIFNTTRSLSPELAQHIEYIRNIDWSKTSLGPMETWSHDLCQLLTLMMLETRPTAAFLGPDNVILYNLGYVAITGKRHPEMLGKRVTDAWPEVTDIARETITGSQGTHQADFMDKEYHLFLERSGFLEETFFKWALVPFVGPVVGLYSIVTEVTKERYRCVPFSTVVRSSTLVGYCPHRNHRIYPLMCSQNILQEWNSHLALHQSVLSGYRILRVADAILQGYGKGEHPRFWPSLNPPVQQGT